MNNRKKEKERKKYRLKNNIFVLSVKKIISSNDENNDVTRATESWDV